MHTPVLVDATIEALNVEEGGEYIDATAGEGGHLKRILEAGGRVLAIDADAKQLEKLAGLRDIYKDRLTLAQGNFADIAQIAQSYQFGRVKGIIMDLGLSMRQLTESGKGFSFKKENDVLDMRLMEQGTVPAAELLSTLSEVELFDIFSKYGEEHQSQAIASKVVELRGRHPIRTVGDLTFCIDSAIGRSDHIVYRRIFQSLRIAVNNELENLRKALSSSLELLEENGRLLVISFHSLEDRIVKDFVRKHGLKTLTKKAIKGNKGLRFEKSALLRVILKQSN